jgi:lysyl-tRNA synthetase class 2
MITLNGLQQRAVFIQGVRNFFIGRGYLEVDTPLRLPALVPEPHIVPEPAGDWFLQTSPELCMKRLLSRGVSQIFQICKCFRRAERGDSHLPEFTMLEWYRTGIDYLELMEECRQLINYLLDHLGLASPLKHGGRKIDLAGKWEMLTVAEAFFRYVPFSMAEALDKDLFDEALVVHIEPQLGTERPTFLYEYPAELGALARTKPENPKVAERFELYINGVELANGFSELTDVKEQHRRFQQDRQTIRTQGREPGPMPEGFLRELAAMPEAGGIALGIDRLAMILFDAPSIDKVVTFVPEEL